MIYITCKLSKLLEVTACMDVSGDEVVEVSPQSLWRRWAWRGWISHYTVTG